MSESFQAVCFAADAGPSRPCRIVLETGNIVIEPAGGAAIRWPYGSLAGAIGGDDHDWVFLSCDAVRSDVARLALQNPAAIAAVATRAWGEARDTLLGFETQRRKHASRHLRGLVAGLVALVISVTAAWLLFTRAGPEIAVAVLPLASEKLVGDAALAHLLAGEQEIVAGPAAEAVRSITARLTAAIERDPGYEFDVRLVESDIVNAVALPGGKIVVYSGLLATAGSADEVAGVMAHEICHVLHRDGLRQVISRLGNAAVISLMLGGGDIAGLVAGAGELDRLAYSRDQERAADFEGLALMARAGLQPAAMAAFFERLQAREPRGIPAILSTHPDTAARIVEIRRLAATTAVANPKPLAIDWAAVTASLE